MQKTVNETIKFLRMSKGMTQGELANAIGVSTNSIASIEAGRSKPSPKNLIALAEALGVKSNDLLNGNVGDVQKDWKEEAYEVVKQENEWLKRMLELALGEKQQYSKLTGNNETLRVLKVA